MNFVQSMGRLALIVVVLPALGYALVLLLSHPRPPAGFAAFYVGFVVVWFLVALPVLALLWWLPSLPRPVVAAVLAYLLLLVLPLASGLARFPLHVIRCGHLPVVGSTFAAGYTYKTPADPDYSVTPFSDRFFCSRSQAEKAGFHE